MRVQLWSYNYAPEPTGIAPVSRSLATGLRDAGHQVSVVGAHPHYPDAGVGALPQARIESGVTGSTCFGCRSGSAAASARERVPPGALVSWRR